MRVVLCCTLQDRGVQIPKSVFPSASRFFPISAVCTPYMFMSVYIYLHYSKVSELNIVDKHICVSGF